MPYKVFISYSTKDKLPTQICMEFERRGVKCWIAPRDIPKGMPYARAIMNALSKSETMLVFISSNSLKSEDVLNEIDNAHGMNKTIIPIFIEKVNLTPEYSYYLKRKQWVNYDGNIVSLLQELERPLNVEEAYHDQTGLQPPFPMEYVFDKISNPPERSNFDMFLMPIEDMFGIKGRGTVVTGRVESGTLKVGEDVWINGLDTSTKSVVTGIEMFRKLVDSTECGDECGILLRGIEKEFIARGMVLAQKPMKMYKDFTAAVYLFREDEGKDFCSISLRTGTTIDVINRVCDQIAEITDISASTLANGVNNNMKVYQKII